MRIFGRRLSLLLDWIRVDCLGHWPHIDYTWLCYNRKRSDELSQSDWLWTSAEMLKELRVGMDRRICLQFHLGSALRLEDISPRNSKSSHLGSLKLWPERISLLIEEWFGYSLRMDTTTGSNISRVAVYCGELHWLGDIVKDGSWVPHLVYFIIIDAGECLEMILALMEDKYHRWKCAFVSHSSDFILFPTTINRYIKEDSWLAVLQEDFIYPFEDAWSINL